MKRKYLRFRPRPIKRRYKKRTRIPRNVRYINKYRLNPVRSIGTLRWTAPRVLKWVHHEKASQEKQWFSGRGSYDQFFQPVNWIKTYTGPSVFWQWLKKQYSKVIVNKIVIELSQIFVQQFTYLYNDVKKLDDISGATLTKLKTPVTVEAESQAIQIIPDLQSHQFRYICNTTISDVANTYSMDPTSSEFARSMYINGRNQKLRFTYYPRCTKYLESSSFNGNDLLKLINLMQPKGKLLKLLVGHDMKLAFAKDETVSQSLVQIGYDVNMHIHYTFCDSGANISF